MEKNKIHHVGISGNIGSGKTTLTQLLSKQYKWIPQYEAVDNNPYLFDFYQDMSRWSFNLQIYFLQARMQQYDLIQKTKGIVVQDRTIYEDAEIFARTLADMSLMSKRDFDNYYQFYQSIIKMIKPPDILIYLKAGIPQLVDQIQKRGRKYEENIRIDYLRRLGDKYERWIENYQDSELIIIDVEKEDFVNNQEHFGRIIERIDATINGLF